jgi:hypothetical protein
LFRAVYRNAKGGRYIRALCFKAEHPIPNQTDKALFKPLLTDWLAFAVGISTKPLEAAKFFFFKPEQVLRNAIENVEPVAVKPLNLSARKLWGPVERFGKLGALEVPPLFDGAAPLGGIALAARSGQVLDVVGAAIAPRNDVVDIDRVHHVVAAIRAISVRLVENGGHYLKAVFRPSVLERPWSLRQERSFSPMGVFLLITLLTMTVSHLASGFSMMAEYFWTGGEYSSDMVARIGLRGARPVRTYFLEWREWKGWTQQELADRMETTAATVSRIEKGDRDWGKGYLEAFAHVIGCPDPSDLDDMLKDAPPELKRQALSVVEALLKTGSER